MHPTVGAALETPKWVPKQTGTKRPSFKSGVRKRAVSKSVVLADALLYQKPKRGYKNRERRTTRTGTRAHSPKPPFYKTALVFPLSPRHTRNMLCIVIGNASLFTKILFTIFVPINPPPLPNQENEGFPLEFLLEGPQTELRTLSQNCEQTLQNLRTNRITNKRAFLIVNLLHRQFNTRSKLLLRASAANAILLGFAGVFLSTLIFFSMLLGDFLTFLLSKESSFFEAFFPSFHGFRTCHLENHPWKSFKDPCP